ncbi:MAG TPA: FAD-dependent oxidoreductase [Pseudolabrys sp.]|nr:FAD-dependent oxidoreductase [Pseudolabrys sp.]
MPRLSRRSFLAASAALMASPAFAAKPSGEDADVIVVGAGAAGIAAARRLAAEKMRVIVFEGSDRIGGRCATDTGTFGVPFDLGAHWIHSPDASPLIAGGAPAGLEVYAAPRWQSVRIGPRAARDAELELFLAAQVRAQRALREPLKGKGDAAAERLLPHDLGAWKGALEFMFGPFTTSQDLANISAADLVRSAERTGDAFCRQGYGALLAKLAAGLNIKLSTPVSMVAWGKSTVLETPESLWYPRAVILTASTNVLAGDDIEFIPPLPKNVKAAIANLPLGSLDHIALDMPGNPLALQKDDLVFEQATGSKTAALLANVSGTSLHVVSVGGAFGRELSAKGEAAMLDFATGWLSSAFDTNVKRFIKKTRVTRWNAQEFVLGAMSAAGPGHADARKVLADPLGRLWLAGEALHETQWGTVNGAWESGTRAAESVLRHFKRGGREEPKARSKQRRKRRDEE